MMSQMPADSCGDRQLTGRSLVTAKQDAEPFLSCRSLIRAMEARFREAGLPEARVEAEWLLADVLGLPTRTELYVREQLLEPSQTRKMLAMADQRCRGTLLPYLTGSVEFFGHRLRVSPDVLIPRPETEVLVARVIAYLQRLALERRSSVMALDLGTGSANIAVSLAKAVSACQVIAVELSWVALNVAKTNMLRHGVSHRVHLVQADCADSIRGPIDVVIANLPYVPTSEVSHPPLLGNGEPRMSLDGGPDGMRLQRRLLADVPRLLPKGGIVCMECAEDQADRLVGEARQDTRTQRAQVIYDLTNRPRGLWIEVSPIS